MHQLIEGIDNAITFIFFFFTLLLAVAVPLYFMRPTYNDRNNTSDEEEDTAPNRTTSHQEHNCTTEPPVDIGQSHNIPNCDRPTERQPPDDIQPESVDSTPPGEEDMISIKVMHNETSQQLSVSKNMLLKDLKQKCYPTEYADGKSIRLIYAGRVLTGETYPLRYLGIMNGCVLHSVVSEPVQEEGRTSESTDISLELDLSEYFLPLVAVMMVVMWTFVMTYTNLFSAVSISILGFLTMLFLGVAFFV